jgi:plasmid maintenance system killer protein
MASVTLIIDLSGTPQSWHLTELDTCCIASLLKRESINMLRLQPVAYRQVKHTISLYMKIVRNAQCKEARGWLHTYRTQEEFKRWSLHLAQQYHYCVQFKGVGKAVGEKRAIEMSNNELTSNGIGYATQVSLHLQFLDAC